MRSIERRQNRVVVYHCTDTHSVVNLPPEMILPNVISVSQQLPPGTHSRGPQPTWQPQIKSIQISVEDSPFWPGP